MQDPNVGAALLTTAWQEGRHIESLPAAQQPRDRAEGYAVQAAWRPRPDRVAGWKIAATSVAGQQHIAVGGPLAGRIFAHRVQPSGASIALASNRMKVAECEIVFHFARPLAPQPGGHSKDEVLAALSGIGPGIEVPDSRFVQFERAGEAQLIADCACANEMVLGPVLPIDERVHTLADLRVRASVSDGRTPEGVGSNVLGDPLAALLWLVDELGSHGAHIEAGQFVTTGACVPPIPVLPGHEVQADFGWLGRMSTSFL